MNRTNLSPTTTAACLATLTEAEKQAEIQLAIVDARLDQSRCRICLETRFEEAERLAANVRAAHQALAEFRQVAGYEDAGDVTHV